MSSSNILMFHPGAGVFVQQAARALYEHGALHRFATTIVDRPNNLLRRALCRTASWFDYDLDAQFKRRAITEIPLELVRNRPWGELARLISHRLDREGHWADRVWERTEHQFDRWASTLIDATTDSVYGYEHACLHTFQAAKRQNLTCIYELPAPEHDFVNDLIRDELARFPELGGIYQDRVEAMQEVRTERRREEWALADLVIVNSEFTKRSYAAKHHDVDKVRVVPLGAPPTHADGTSEPNSRPFVALWAGTFSVRKGAHYVLEAWNRLNMGSDARLDVYGHMELPVRLLRQQPSTDIHWSGTIPRTRLFEKFRRAHVLIFPTLCDGFGMVVTEALAHGLPVITTANAGASQFIRHGENGLIVNPRDSDAIVNAVEWCLDHPEELQRMRQGAIETARAWQWQDFRRQLGDEVKRFGLANRT